VGTFKEYALKARPIFHVALLVAATVYVLAIPLGLVPKDNRFQLEEVALVGILAIVSSSLMDSLADITIGKEGVTARFKEIEHRQEKQEDELSRQQAEIRSLQVALQGIVTQYEMDKLVGLSKPGEFLCYYSDDLYNELKRLRALGLIINHAGTGLTSIRRDYKDKGERFDLKRFFALTDQGAEYLKLRGDLLRLGAAG
jgi:hypothetical protein